MEHLTFLQSKIVPRVELLERDLSYWRFKKQRIVFTNGCFDIMHRGHIEYLAQAASLGDVLIIGLNTDESVSRLKGPERPIVDELSRATALAGLGFVAKVVYFDEDTPLELISVIKPDFLVKGGDYKVEEIVGFQVVTQNGGEVLTIPLVDGFSTTSLVNKIRNTEGDI